jgi:hypothetical protein
MCNSRVGRKAATCGGEGVELLTRSDDNAQLELPRLFVRLPRQRDCHVCIRLYVSEESGVSLIVFSPSCSARDSAML